MVQKYILSTEIILYLLHLYLPHNSTQLNTLSEYKESQF